VQRWQGDLEAQRAVYANRARLRSGVAREALKLRVERSFEHTLDRGGLRRTHLRGRANVQKRYLIHVAGFNLGLVMRLLLGAGTPKEFAARGGLAFWLIDPAAGFVLLVILQPHGPFEPTNDRSGPRDRGADIVSVLGGGGNSQSEAARRSDLQRVWRRGAAGSSASWPSGRSARVELASFTPDRRRSR
jgi:hypothetical protein